MTQASKVALNTARDIPFNKLVLSQNNVRRIKDGVSIEHLSDDIDSVRQCGGNYGVVEVAIGHSAAVAIWVGTALIVGGVSSAIASVCM